MSTAIRKIRSTIVEEEPLYYDDDGTPRYRIIYNEDGSYAKKRGQKSLL